jgi:glycogen phosphorylase
MGNPMYTTRPTEVGDTLGKLALDLRWAWNHATDEVWRRLEPELWDLTRNPWLVLQTISRQRLESLWADPELRELVDRLAAEEDEKRAAPAWFETAHPHSPLKTVAYFSMEYMLSEALPIYSGGLGNVAGDQLKAASDLGVPVTGIGLLYQQGYFRQEIDQRGAQIALYPFNDPGQLPITPLRDANGDWLRLPLMLPGFTLWIRAWQVRAGRRTLYLLDTNDPANLPEQRCIAHQLYGGGPEIRLRQEIVLGIAGWRLLRALDIHPQVCHLNEGHAALAVLERARNYMEDTGVSFEQALTITRPGNLFTTHTAVDAAFDRFHPDLIRQYLWFYAQDRLHISMDDFLALGRKDPGDGSEPFNMAYLAIRGSGAVNGVSRLHGQVSRRLMQPLFPRWPENEVPVGHVTNGVHVPTWDSAEADDLWTDVCGRGVWRGDLATTEACFRKVDDRRLWSMLSGARKSMIEYARRRYQRQLAGLNASPAEIDAAQRLFDSNALTLGFARRFATYKRPNLLLYDPDRLARILTNSQRPAQLILAGKAHPEDGAGQAMIRQWNDFIRRPDVRPHVAFLSDYDMLLTERLVQGVDVWINTPRRPWEASGTSGMKVLVNGGLNLSELDGWWAEAYTPEVGWAVGDGNEHGDDPGWDRAEADALYGLLENQVIPEFYDRDAEGIPRRWVARMRESMARLTPVFSANRAVRQYAEEYYLPAAAAYAARSAEGGKLGAAILGWQNDLARHWDGVRFGRLEVQSLDGVLTFKVEVYFGELDPNSVRIELFANTPDGGQPFRAEMRRDGSVYWAQAPATRPASDFTPRVIPCHPAALAPLEANQILWQK